MLDGDWQVWSVEGRAGATLKLGSVFAAQVSYPHDQGLGPRWKAWLNNESFGLFRTEHDAREYIETEIAKRIRLMQPGLARFEARQRRSRLTVVGPIERRRAQS